MSVEETIQRLTSEQDRIDAAKRNSGLRQLVEIQCPFCGYIFSTTSYNQDVTDCPRCVRTVEIPQVIVEPDFPTRMLVGDKY